MLSFIKLPIYGFEFEPRVIEYYFVFVLGTVSGMIIQHENPKELFYPLIIYFCLILVKVIFYFSGMSGAIFHPFNLPLFLTLLGLIFFILLMNLHFYIPLQSIPKIIMIGSYSSYSAYLLHYPILCVLATTGIQNLYLFVIVSIFFVFSSGYVLQYCIDKIFDKKRSLHSSIIYKTGK